MKDYMKKIQDQLKAEFKAKHANSQIMLNGTNWSMTLNEFVEQDSWRRK